MTRWTLILCEGAHDQAALAAVARVFNGWVRFGDAPRALPEDLKKTFPQPKQSRSGGWEYERAPDYLTKNGHYLVVRNLRGKDQLLGEAAEDLLGQLSPNALGVFVDANEKGISARVKSFRRCFDSKYPYASKVEAGTVSAEIPRLGLWVAPDNKNCGRLDDLLVEVVSQTRPELAAAGKSFIEALAAIEAGKWQDHRNKAMLGAIHQTVRPGASLAVCLQESSGWLEPSSSPVEPLEQLVRFLETLTALPGA
jgi:hypothetical protein